MLQGARKLDAEEKRTDNVAARVVMKIKIPFDLQINSGCSCLGLLLTKLDGWGRPPEVYPWVLGLWTPGG